EYALILAVIAVAVIAVMVTMGDKIKETFTGVSDNLGGATEGGTTE
ncbi:MAG TPA: Flp family type IVb pilin, partial [Candidatus Gracilibacteria bacterium]